MRKRLLFSILFLIAFFSFSIQGICQQNPSILATKSLISVIESGDSLIFNFQIRVDNDGDRILDSLRLNDFLPFPAGSVAISVLTHPTTGMLIPNPSYDGDSDRRVFTPGSGNMATLGLMGFYNIELIAKVHFDDYYATPKPMVNIARAVSIDENGNIEDFDRLTIEFGRIRTIKELTNVMVMDDSVALDFNFKVINIGTLDLDSLRLRDDIPLPFGSYVISVEQQPTTGTLIPNPNYDGELDPQLLTFASGNASVLECRDTIEVTLSLKVAVEDVNQAPKPIMNTVIGIGDTPTGERLASRSVIELVIPIIQVEKTFEGYTVMGDSIEFAFDILVENKGTTILDSLRMNDPLPFAIGSASIVITQQPTTGMLVRNPVYNGDTERRVFTPASGNMATLDPGDIYSIELVAKAHFDDYYAAPKPLINITRAISLDENGNIEDFGRDTVRTSLIHIEKELSDFMEMGDSVSLTFNFQLVNTGTEVLDSLRLRDDLPFGFGSSTINIIRDATTGGLIANPNYDGEINQNIITGGSGNNSTLACRDTMEVELTIKVHLDSIKLAPKPILNTAFGVGDDPDGVRIADRSTIALYIPVITITKALSDITISGDSAMFTFNYELINCGSDTLNLLRLNDKLPFKGGSNTITVVKQPSEGMMAANSLAPYSGNGMFPKSIENNLINTFSGGTGVLYPGDTMGVELQVKTDVCEYVLLPVPLFNSASGSGNGLQSGIQAEDQSDDRTSGNPDGGSLEDPTPLPLLPKVEMRKTLEDFAINGDSVKFTFNFVAKNIGNDTLDRIRIGDKLPFTGGTNMIVILEQPSEGVFLPNPNFTGNDPFISQAGNDLLNTFANPSGRRLYPGDSVEVQLMVNASLCMYNNLMIPQENPARATVDGVTTDIRVIDEGFALLPPLPGITLNKSISKSPAPAADDEGLFTATVLLELRNSGNTHLTELFLTENFADHYGCAFLGLTGPPTVVGDFVTGDVPVIQIGFTGDGTAPHIIEGSGFLNPGDSLAIAVELLLDPRCDGVYSPLINSAFISAYVVDGQGNDLDDYFGRPFGILSDISDDHTDFDMDMVYDNESGEKNDPTRLYLPNLAVTKAFVGKEKLMDGDLLLTFEYEVRNTGNAIMDSLMLDDEIEFFPVAMGNTPGTPFISFDNIDANTLPTVNPLWDGYLNIALWDGESGVLLPGESFLMTLEFEIDPYAYTAIQPQPRLNQAIVGGLPKEVTGAQILNPETGNFYETGDVEDHSDDGTELEDYGDPLSDNPGAEGEGLGDNAYDDPTPINICKTYCEVEARKITHISLGASCMLEITASMVGLGIEPYCDYYYTVRLLDHHDNPFPSNKVDASFLGEEIKVEITEPECGNVSWGYALIEDKVHPIIECVNETISCLDSAADPIPPMFSDNCGGAEIEMRNEVYLNMPCHDEFTGRIVRTWVAVDTYGNESDPCIQTIYLKRVDLGELTPPPHHSEMTQNALECGSGYAEDSNGNPHPSVAGVPTLNGMDVYPMADNVICNGYVEYEDDVKSDPLGCKTRIQRTWVIGEWHCSRTIEKIFVQFIDIIDNTPPVITYCPEDIVVSTGRRSCEGDVVLPPVEFDDACTDVHVNMQTPVGTLLNSNGGKIRLEAGWYSATYEVVDACHNVNNTCTVDIHVVDQKNPIAICDQDLSVSLNSNGVARILATDVDLESFDDCSKLTYEIRRMEDACDESGTDWAEEIYFCCEDAGTDIMVALQVTDKSSNTNICMVEVGVQDKKDPVMECIDDVVITCADTYAMNNLAGAFGLPEITDNCPSTNTIRETFTDDIDQCGLGSIHRIFSLIDATGKVVQTCEQWITIETEMEIQERDIDWPDDFEMDGACQGSDAFHPDNLPEDNAYPDVPDGFCNLVGWKYSDEVYDATTGSEACFKIIRTWKVIDWCNPKTDDRVFPTWEKEQIIKVFNTMPPTILSSCQDTLIESSDPECGEVYVPLTLDAEDDCTPLEDLLITWEIDEDDDGGPVASGEGADASGAFPLGTHRIYWEVEDRCGHITRCDYTFEVRNTKAATPICLDGVSIDLVAMDTDEVPGKDTAMAILTPDMIDAKSEHPCGYELQLSFSPDVNDTELILGCGDVGEIPVSLWVTASNGAQSSCNITILVTANGAEGFCGGMNVLVDIEGEVSNMRKENIEGVDVELKGSELPDFRTAEDGKYTFNDMPVGGNYEVSPSKDDDPLNGVSTLDIVMITRHVLGITDISSPYVMLAADINNNGSISATDIIELRKVILGHYDNFPSNTSWKFVDSNFNFSNGINALEEVFPETHELVNLSENVTVDFIGVKVGDISGDAAANARQRAISGRSNEIYVMKAHDRYVEKGDRAVVEIFVEGTEELYGWQMEVKTKGLIILGTEGSALEITPSHLYLEDHLMRMSINELNGATANAKIFSIILEVEENGYLSDMISLSNDRLKSEAYLNSTLDVNDLALEWLNPEGEKIFMLEQNQPNPWSDQTTIDFTIPNDGLVTIIVRDVAGKLLKNHQEYFRAGKNQFALNNQEITASGVLLYEVIYGSEKLNNKMIKVKY